MSATLPNAHELADWMMPCCVHAATGKREVPLDEYIVELHNGARVLDGRGQPTDRQPLSVSPPLKTNAVAAALCRPRAHEERGVLCFCPSKQACVNLAVEYALSALRSPLARTAGTHAFDLSPAHLFASTLFTRVSILPDRPGWHSCRLCRQRRTLWQRC